MIIRIISKLALVTALTCSCYYASSDPRQECDLVMSPQDISSLRESYPVVYDFIVGSDGAVSVNGSGKRIGNIEDLWKCTDYRQRTSESTTKKVLSNLLHMPSAIVGAAVSGVGAIISGVGNISSMLVSKVSDGINAIRYYFMTREEKCNALAEKDMRLNSERNEICKELILDIAYSKAGTPEEKEQWIDACLEQIGIPDDEGTREKVRDILGESSKERKHIKDRLAALKEKSSKKYD